MRKERDRLLHGSGLSLGCMGWTSARSRTLIGQLHGLQHVLEHLKADSSPVGIIHIQAKLKLMAVMGEVHTAPQTRCLVGLRPGEATGRFACHGNRLFPPALGSQLFLFHIALSRLCDDDSDTEAV